MSFVRKKRIGNNEYLYRVRNYRKDGKVCQKVEEYLGKAEDLGTTNLEVKNGYKKNKKGD